MSHRITHTDDIGAKVFGEVDAPMSRPAEATRKPVILVHRPSSAAASDGFGDATEPDLGFEQLGSVAVRVMARFTLPRMQMLPVPAGYEEESRDRRLNLPGEDQD